MIANMAAILLTGLFGMSTGLEELSESFWYDKRSVLSTATEVQGDYFSFSPHVVISGTVHGDVYAAGGEVLVDGTVDGDLIAAGGTITVSGKVSQDARIAGGRVMMSGTIGRNATIAAGDVVVADAALIQGNWLGAGGTIELAGPVNGHARIAAGKVIVSERIGGDLAVAAPSIRLMSNASVGKSFRYWSESEPSLDQGVTIRGTAARQPFPDSLKEERLSEGLVALRLAGMAISFVSTLVFGLILVRAYPFFGVAVDWTIRERPLASLALGIGALVIAPLLILLCFATVLGIPIGLVLGALFAVTLYIARIYVMLWAGHLLLLMLTESITPGWAFFTGLVLYSLCGLIPFVGNLVTLLTLILGLGALLLTRNALIQQLRDRKLV